MNTYVLYPTKEHEDIINAFLKANKIIFYKDEEELPPHVLEGIKQGREDVEAARTISLEDFKKRMLLFK